jgi:hypothetical protein
MSNSNCSRGSRPDVERDFAAHEALTKAFANREILSLSWSSTHEDFVRYEARATNDGRIVSVVVDLLHDDGAVVTVRALRQTFFVCACGALLWSAVAGEHDSRPDNAHEIAATADDADGPAVACSDCALGRPTDEGFRDTISCAPPACHCESFAANVPA